MPRRGRHSTCREIVSALTLSTRARLICCSATASAARHETPVLIRRNENALMENARRNRYADFRLRGVLGMVAGVRHTARHQLWTSTYPP
jgi:hypothetical protein